MVLWIDWGQHRRSQTLARRLGVELHEICWSGARAWRYARSLFQTLKIIANKRPQTVIATVPSIVLGYSLLFFRRWFKFKLVLDAHYFGVVAPGENHLHQNLLNFLNVRADLVIVTNESQAESLSGMGVKTFVCQDPLPVLPESGFAGLPQSDRTALLICSFDEDEPYEAVFEAFKDLGEQGLTLFVSGNPKKVQIETSRFPWVRFLGFLSDADYYGYLRACAVIIDLTTFENCLVCGAYEALAAGKPLVVSNSAALSAYFGNAVILTDNKSDSIRKAVLTAFAQRDELGDRIQKWVSHNGPYMDERIGSLSSRLTSLSANAPRGGLGAREREG